MPLYEEVTLDRDDVRVRKCWWVSGCCTKEITLASPPVKEGGKEKPPTKVDWKYTVEVTEQEARTGLGRKCPMCGKKMGCYVCDGFPTFQGSVVFKETEKDAKGPE